MIKLTIDCEDDVQLGKILESLPLGTSWHVGRVEGNKITGMAMIHTDIPNSIKRDHMVEVQRGDDKPIWLSEAEWDAYLKRLPEGTVTHTKYDHKRQQRVLIIEEAPDDT